MNNIKLMVKVTYKYVIHGLKVDIIFLYFIKKYSDKIKTNKLGTKLKSINIYGY